MLGPDFQNPGVALYRAPAAARRVQLNAWKACLDQGQALSRIATGRDLDQIHGGQIVAQGRQAPFIGLIGQDQPGLPHKLGQQARLASGAGAHVQNQPPPWGLQEQWCKH